MTDKQISDWQEKVRATFGDENKLYQYLFETMDNFYYRYLETTQNQNLKTQKLASHIWGARSTEGSMVDALKIKNPEAKKGIIELAKTVPKAQGPAVQYELSADVQELTPEHGKIIFVAQIDWGFPDYQDDSRKFKKTVVFKYSDLAQFRKELAQKLEDVCETFL